MARIRITNLTLNSEKPLELVRFWTEFLGVKAHPHNENSEHIFFHPQEPGGIRLAIQKVTKKHHTDSEIHFDIATDDLDALEEKALSLGAKLESRTRLDNGFEWRVLHDPQNNPFCIFTELE